MIGFSCIIRVLYVAFTCIEVDGAVDTDVGYQAEAFVDTDVVAYFMGMFKWFIFISVSGK